jgi:hypothetical protein
MPDGTTLSAHVVNTCVPAEQCPKKPIFITGFNDNRGFLSWLRASCPNYLTAQLKAETLMVVPSTADGFRATVSALRSIDGRESVRFHRASRGPLGAAAGKEPRQAGAREHCP